MTATRVLASALTAIALTAGASPPAWSGDDGTRATPSVVDLPRGWQPEGITTDGTSLFVGSLRHGGIWRVNPATDRERLLHQGKEGRVAVGIDHDRRRGLLWVAGGPTGMVRAHDVGTGRIKARYDFGDGRFVNDLTVTRRAVYATDSTSNQPWWCRCRGAQTGCRRAPWRRPST